MDNRHQNLDELFKEKLTSEKYAYPFNQNDWDVLEEKLNLSQRHKHHVFLFRTLTGAAAALIIFFFIWMLKTNEPILLRSQTAKSIKHKPTDTPATTREPQKEIGNKVESIHESESIAITRDSITRLLNTVEILEDRNKIDDDFRVHTLNKVADSIFQPFHSLDKLPSTNTSLLNNQLTNVAIDSDQGLDPDKSSQRSIVLSVFVAPALNAVNGFKNGEIGSDLGVLFSVDISKKLTISTGAIYAKKFYETDFNRNVYSNIGNEYGKGGYNAANENSEFSVFPESVYADCRVLDIPLNINYSIIDKGKNKVSIGTGMSSYMMLKETYQFEYDQDYINSEKVELVNENKHIMSVLNFQANYARQLNSKIGVSLQPYLKIPLRDIGFAKTKLQSAGMAVNINFMLNGKK